MGSDLITAAVSNPLGVCSRSTNWPKQSTTRSRVSRRKPPRNCTNGSGAGSPGPGADTPSLRYPPRSRVMKPSRPPVSTSMSDSADAMSSSADRSTAGIPLPSSGNCAAPARLSLLKAVIAFMEVCEKKRRITDGSVMASPPALAACSMALRIALATILFAPCVRRELPWTFNAAWGMGAWATGS